MPELPEVETIRRKLERGGDGCPSLRKQQIESALLLWERSLEEPAVAVFLKKITGQTIEKLERRGKYFVFTLSKDTLIFHLRMSGDLKVTRKNANLNPYTRVAFNFVGNWRLEFINPRKFGRVWLVNNPDAVLTKLGPEPFDSELNAEVFYGKLQTHKRQIKPLLMDQSFIAGLGNIYTDEALFLAHLHPRTISQKISFQQGELLLNSIRRVLSDGIRRCGASIDWIYQGGDFQNYFNVYGRKGKLCGICGGKIQRIVVGNRGTYFCENCQPLLR